MDIAEQNLRLRLQEMRWAYYFMSDSMERVYLRGHIAKYELKLAELERKKAEVKGEL